LGSTTEPASAVYRIVYNDVPFEDINNNFKYDPGIDPDLDGHPDTLRRGDDRNGDGKFDWNPDSNDVYIDFNGNGKCDPDAGEPIKVIKGDTVWADLNGNGVWDHSEIVGTPKQPGKCTEPASGDYPFMKMDIRKYLLPFAFTTNDFAVAIEVSAVTKDGVAHAKLRYPRQLATRLFVSVNAEANGVRDRDGERFLLPVLKGK
jgi:hypothetical protein